MGSVEAAKARLRSKPDKTVLVLCHGIYGGTGQTVLNGIVDITVFLGQEGNSETRCPKEQEQQAFVEQANKVSGNLPLLF